MACFARILLITRSFADFSEAKNFVALSAGAEVEVAMGAILQLDDTMKTRIASGDMSVHAVPPGTVFVKETMMDEFGQGGEHQAVAGTAEIGLLQRLGNVQKVILERDLAEP